MKTLVVTLLMLSMATGAYAGEGEPNDQASRMRRGQTITKIGIGLLAAGAIVLPVTAGHEDTHTHMWTGLGLIGGGGALMLWGANEKRQASWPHTTIGVTFGRVSGLQIRRAW